MKIYTSYFENLKNIPADIVPISIAGKAPDWYDGIQYKRLAPKGEENGDKHFNEEVLDWLNPNSIYESLRSLSKGKDCVLLCYEPPGEFCHRHPVAQWLNRDVKEI